MRYIFKFPDIGEGLDEGTIIEWYVKKGQHVKSGDPLVKMETDKVVTDIPSPREGTIAAIYGKIGETIHVGSPLVEIDMGGDSSEATTQDQTNTKQEVVEEGAGVVGTLETAGNNAYLPSSSEGFEEAVISQQNSKKAMATPVARAFAKEMGIDINNITGTGPAGRVTKQDIQSFVERKPSVSHTAKTAMSNPVELVEIESLSQLRKTIAKNMITSKHNAAHMTLFEEVEIDSLIELRKRYKDNFEKQGVKLSYLPFIIKFLALALKKHKVLNSEMDIENNRLIYKKYYNIGIAVDTPDGLVVPVVKDADKLSVFEIARQINELSEKAREKKLKLEEMKDGTFTITNYGSIGGLFAVPVINYPQAAILGIGRIVKKPVVKDDSLAVGQVLPLSLSVDHRIVDGGEVTRFINTLMGFLNDPASAIME